MIEPVVTVLMPVYNGEKFLSEAIESILNQSFTNFEFLIINDGSTDQSEQIISRFKDSRITYIKNDKNLGIIKTLNKGLMLSKGKYIARMDCDDISNPDRLQKQIKYLDNHPGTAVVATKIEFVNEIGAREGYWEDDILTNTYDEIKSYLPKLNCIAHPSIVIRKSLAVKYLYKENQKHSEDWDLWLRLISDGHIIEKLDEILLSYRIHSNSVTSNANRQNLWKKIFKVQQRFLINKLKTKSLNQFDKVILKNSLVSFDNAYFKGRFRKTFTRITAFLYKKIFLKLRGYFYFLYMIFKIGNAKNTNGYFFFFPFYHVGGAERVHIDILNIVKHKQPWIIITHISSNKAFLQEFKDKGKLFELGKRGPIRTYIYQKLFARKINKQDKPLSFGCNNALFYSIASQLKKEAVVIDLIHAFSEKGITAAEDYSLPVVDRLDRRVFISKKAIDDLKNQYMVHRVDLELLKRVVYIPNYTFIPDNWANNPGDKMQILYVGRGTEEKRVHLVAQIAEQCHKRNLSCEFILIGNVGNSIPNQYKKFVKAIGEIKDQVKLSRIYKGSQVVLITSTREGMPMVIMEGMAHGLVPISTAVGDCPLHIKNYHNGFIVENYANEDLIVKDFVNYIEQISNNRSLFEQLSQNAYEYAKENFGIERFQESYKQLLLNE
jgi:glycosyltransferase involved in cell wall biosynthesis